MGAYLRRHHVLKSPSAEKGLGPQLTPHRARWSKRHLGRCKLQHSLERAHTRVRQRADRL
jgi:hypothetical protein